MGKWIAILTTILLLGSFFFFGVDSFFSTTPGNFEEEEISFSEGNTIITRHAFQDGIHRYSGIFRLPHSCFAVEQSGLYRDGAIRIGFEVMDKKGLVSPCIDITTRYPFTVIVEAPENTPEIFTLNGEVVPSQIRKIQWQSPSGTLIDPGATTIRVP